MLENELNKIWQNSTREELVKFNASKLLIDLDSKLESFDRCIKNRDRREIIAAIFIMLVFGVMTFFIPQLLSKMGILRGVLYGTGLMLGVIFGILVIYKLRHVKKFKADNYSLSTKDYLIKHQQYLIKERSLLEKVLYWYTLPATLSTILIFVGVNLGSTQTYILILISLVVNAYAYYINKRTVKKDFNPLIEKLDVIINELKTIE